MLNQVTRPTSQKHARYHCAGTSLPVCRRRETPPFGAGGKSPARSFRTRLRADMLLRRHSGPSPGSQASWHSKIAPPAAAVRRVPAVLLRRLPNALRLARQGGFGPRTHRSWHWTIAPSAAILSPSRTSIRSPGTRSALVRCSRPSRTTCAFGADRSRSASVRSVFHS